MDWHKILQECVALFSVVWSHHKRIPRNSAHCMLSYILENVYKLYRIQQKTSLRNPKLLQSIRKMRCYWILWKCHAWRLSPVPFFNEALLSVPVTAYADVLKQCEQRGDKLTLNPTSINAFYSSIFGLPCTNRVLRTEYAWQNKTIHT